MSTVSEIVIVGDEILHGEITDKNGPWLIDRLAELGITVRRCSIVADDPADIGEEIQTARSHGVDYVFVTGGIGPTHDDRTREGVARGLERDQESHSQVLDWLDHYYDEDMNEARRRMANLPAESQVILLENTPAISFRTDNVYVFPGIPELMKGLFEKWQEQFDHRSRFTETVVIRAREGDIADPLRRLQRETSNCRLGSYPHPDGTLTLKIRGDSEEEVRAAHKQVVEQFEDALIG